MATHEKVMADGELVTADETEVVVERAPDPPIQSDSTHAPSKDGYGAAEQGPFNVVATGRVDDGVRGATPTGPVAPRSSF